MKPDDEMLALWVEDELEGAACLSVEQWAADQPEWLEMRETARSAKQLLAGALPADEDVPHAEFFNARIRREIELASKAVPMAPPAPARPRPGLKIWFMPLTAVAGVALGFWLGDGRTSQGPAAVPAPVADLSPVLYTPERGVKAQVVPADDATVIVLAGVDALPDTWEIPETAVLESDEIERTAANGGQ